MMLNSYTFQYLLTIYFYVAARISVRKSTAAKTSETQQRVKVRTEAQKNRPKVSKYDDWIPTQEELLEEALITEEENIASLGAFLTL